MEAEDSTVGQHTEKCVHFELQQHNIPDNEVTTLYTALNTSNLLIVDSCKLIVDNYK
jgi:hypothetical protein